MKKLSILLMLILLIGCNAPQGKTRTYVIYHHGITDTVQGNHYKRRYQIIRIYDGRQLVYDVELDTLRIKVID